MKNHHHHWHTLTANEVAKNLETNHQTGLNAAQVAERTARHGPNALHEKRRRSPWRMLLDQFTEFMIIVLIVAAIISGFVGDIGDTIFIIVIVILNAAVGFVQEFRAERAMAALKRMSEASARVLRDGQVETVNASELVPGDVVLLEAGNVVPADFRLVEAAQLRIDESALTGESVAVEKQIHPLSVVDAPLGDKTCLAYKGTIVTYGRGRGLVIATGMQSELGKIATLLSEGDDSKTPLQKRLAGFGKWISLAALTICVLVFIIGITRGEPLLLMFMTSVSLAVAAIPSALPAVVTISLALGAHKMVKQHALIQSLPAVETLGSVTFICSDKTGTLTQNKMHVTTLYADGELCTTWQDEKTLIENKGNPWITLFHALALSNDAHLDSHGKIQGEPTEAAFLRVAKDAGWDKVILEHDAPRLKELAFDSERKRMTTFHRTADGVIAYTKGSPEALVSQCENMLTSSGEQAIDQAVLLQQAEAMAANGLRVLAFAYRHWKTLPDGEQPDELERDLIFLGFAGLIDPPRSEAKEAVSLCKSAGITPVMITGDHPATARAIAYQLGILADSDGRVMTGAELANLDEKTFEAEVELVRVYARVDPAQKIKIVRALQDKGEIVAMTGDGVNDAPALKAADIGIAMGKGGTDVAREAARMVLLDDNFATIVHAVRYGRRLYDNIRKFVRYAVTTNSAEVLTIFLAPFLGLPIPLLPTHILWINLVTDGLPALALTAEPAERGVMRRPPRPPQESLFSHGMWQHMIWVGLLMAGLTLFAQAWAYHTGSSHWQTMAFTVLTLSQLAHVMAIRSEKESLFSIGILSNLPLAAAVIVTFMLQMATIYVPAFNTIFKTEPLSMNELIVCIALSSVVFIAVEIEKWLVRHGWLYRTQRI
ncbi:calcium-translocating P-type ATPase, PMCA-type [Methylotenera sp.]|uniref:calcium-translocating P-type ATPase, PMCA-type n=1 Tax=Methylotenera sp. TaxID=2051956 RepID=UPI0027221FA1|nr:calcium-translocating P-type ATPase, PMCA-type [Methylotenera sp.]MDO9204554.1 calcium-translocating P-type ATPase, PMCA-type [Methylotenera sp.]MDP2071466.1 calcium-translocating P-type ATPase, PMCA-type [Methylotenera sp.]MDP2230375.1 calcium-translocating P-type ATPase, PMCA-type [Methylotenera sp.]MDP3005427.1 calcium-translocating P-type ATPase, PMCA-type [Methylotenera sp.]MDP3141628.1 calcium-translocating P-type ATPase, PMCA-type [Methylotenera sp.]